MSDKGLSSSRWAAGCRTRSVPPASRQTDSGAYNVSNGGNTHTTNTNTPTTTTTTTRSASPTKPPPRPNGAPASSIPPPIARQPAPASSTLLPPAAELARYTKIVRRLKWKLPFLAAGYHQAISCASSASSEAELMFKLDFFEYYMLCERALVHLLSVFGLAPPRGTAPQHRYHAAVLEALDKQQQQQHQQGPDGGEGENPLHEALGTGEVRRQLGRAKELRNRWKYADADEDGGDVNGWANGNGAQNDWQHFDAKSRKRRIEQQGRPSLESYDLERMLETIFAGFDKAYVVAEEFVARRLAEREEQRMVVDDDDGAPAAGDEHDDQWDFMVDAMDWEAV